jgi:hypothetical protein
MPFSFTGKPSDCAAILEPILLQQVPGPSADKMINEIPCGNQQMNGNVRGENFLIAKLLSISGN